MKDSLALLIHPVRLRLMRALRAGGRLTTSELCERLPDLSKATIYRQVERLTRGGMFQVDGERKVRGVIERHYRLNPAAAVVKAEDAKAMTRGDHREAFTATMAALLGDFGNYLDRGSANPFTDQVSYRQFTVWLSPAERSGLIDELTKIVLALSHHSPSPQRTPHVLSTVFFPLSLGRSSARLSRNRQAVRPLQYRDDSSSMSAKRRKAKAAVR